MIRDIAPPRERGLPRRMLVVAHDAMLYGAQRSLLDILVRIDRNRYEPHVVIPSPGPFTVALRELGIPFSCGLVQRWIFFPKPMTVRAIMRRPWRRLSHPYVLALLSWLSLPLRVILLALLVRKLRIDFVYTNTATVLDGALAAWICGIPHVWHLREKVAGNRGLISPLPVTWLPKFSLRFSTLVIANSYALARHFFGSPLPNKVHVAYNGIDLVQFEDQPPPSGLPYLPDGVRLTAICAALQEDKDIITSIRAMSRLSNSHPELHHLIIGQGQGSYRALIEKEIARYELKERVHILGYRNDFPKLLTRIDILLSTSLHESFGRTLVEAMASGKPVIATRSGGPEEIIVDGKCGFLVNVGDDAAIAERVSRLLDETGLYERMSRAARERVLKNFDLMANVNKVEQIFDEALADRRNS
jgi:glycosyltransferase involved in cell wall biosynthesis